VNKLITVHTNYIVTINTKCDYSIEAVISVLFVLFLLMLFVEGGNRSWTCRVDVGFKVELCKVFRRRADDEVKVSVTLLESVLVWVYLRLRPWCSAALLSLAQQQDTHTKGGIFLQVTDMLLKPRRRFRVCHNI
jgi:uncharacterized protein YggT (Ycf19 family)